MFGLSDKLGMSPEAPLRILGVGAHADDLEIGAGGTMLRLLHKRPYTSVRWVVLTGKGTAREEEARRAAEAVLSEAEEWRVEIAGYRDGFLFANARDAKEYFEERLKEPLPHVVLTHAREDRHQDHRLVSDLTWNTFRGRTPIVEYEVLKWDGDLVQPNAYVSLSEATARRKCALLLSSFDSQHNKSWYDAEAFMGLMRVRGVECASAYAEAFTCRKLIW